MKAIIAAVLVFLAPALASATEVCVDIAARPIVKVSMPNWGVQNMANRFRDAVMVIANGAEVPAISINEFSSADVGPKEKTGEHLISKDHSVEVEISKITEKIIRQQLAYHGGNNPLRETREVEEIRTRLNDYQKLQVRAEKINREVKEVTIRRRFAEAEKQIIIVICEEKKEPLFKE